MARNSDDEEAGGHGCLLLVSAFITGFALGLLLPAFLGFIRG
jgi:hypothetical protein